MELKANDIINELVETKDIRITSQRRKILEILIENRDKHLSVEDIYNVSKKQGKSVAIPTIYRTMDILQKSGIVIKNDFGDGIAKYELYVKEKETIHYLICKRCGKIIEVTGLLPDNLNSHLLEEHGFQAIDTSLKIYGYCDDCMYQEGKFQ